MNDPGEDELTHTAESDDGVSKTQRKRIATEQQDLGEYLTTLKPGQLGKLPLGESLQQAIADYQRIGKNFGAKRRQLQFIGRLMREADSEAIKQAIDKLDGPTAALIEQRRQEALRRLATRLLERGDPAIQELITQHPELSRQTLRQLHRAYVKESNSSQVQHLSKCIKLLRDCASLAPLARDELDSLAGFGDNI